MTEAWSTAEAKRLLVPGRRLGWTFRHPEKLTTPFPDPRPQPARADPNIERLIRARHGAYRRRRSDLNIILILAVLGLLVLAAMLAASGSGNADVSASDRRNALVSADFLVLIAVGLAGLFGFIVYRGRWAGLKKQFDEKNAALQRDSEQRLSQWQQRKTAHEREQAQMKARAYWWLPVAVPSGERRLDIVGGSPTGWQALLTVYGASLLCERPVLVIDLSWGEVVHDFAALAQQAGKRVRTERLPARLAESAVCADLTSGQLVDALVAAIHSRDQTPGGRAERSRDHHILSLLADALTATVTIGRLTAAVQVLTNETAADPRLGAEEIAGIRDGLFTRDNLAHMRPALHGLESWMHPLQNLGDRHTPATAADLTCITLAGNRRNPGNELLAELIVQDLTHRIDALAAQRPATGVIIAGTEELATDHVDRLAGAAQRRGVPLTLLFRHLRESSHLIGGGTVAFMRLGNHEDAGHAAEFIGRHHTFVLSSMTHTQGGNETATTATSDGQTHTRTKSGQVGLSANPVSPTAGLSLTAGASRSDAVQRSHTWSRADGTTWSDATTIERANEYTVEPSGLQGLPEYAMLLAEPVNEGPTKITPVEVNPQIAALPKTDPGRPGPSFPV